MARFFGCFAAVLAFFWPAISHGEVTVVSQHAEASALTVAIDLFGLRVEDSRQEIEDALVDDFSANLFAASSGFAANNLTCGESVANSADATVLFDMSATRSPSGLTVTGSHRVETNASTQEGCQFGSNFSEGEAFLEFVVAITETPELMRFSLTRNMAFSADSAFTTEGQVFSSNLFGTALSPGNPFIPTQAVFHSRAICSNGSQSTGGPGVCAPEGEASFEQILQPGTYVIRLLSSTRSFIRADNTANCDFEFSIGTPSCAQEWAALSNGDFAVPENWSPQRAPANDGAGCGDLIFDLPGGYTVTYGGAAAADSLTVRQGAPVFSGGTLTLGGKDNTALHVLGQGLFTLDGGSVEADTALIGGTGARLLLEPGSALTATTSLETGRGQDESGAIEFGGAGGETRLSVVGDATLGGSGTSIVIGQGPAFFDVLGDLSMAVFPGSESGLVLGETTENTPAPITLTVGGKFTVGGGGDAVATLDGGVTANADSIGVGVLEQGTGTLNLISGASLNVTNETAVGGGGVGLLNVSGGGALTSEDVTVDGPSGEKTPTLALSGLGSDKPAQADVGFALVIGNQKNGELTMQGNSLVNTEFLTIGVLEDSFGLATLAGDPELDLNGINTATVKAAQFMLVGQQGTGRFETSGVANHEFGALILGANPSGAGTYIGNGASNSATITNDLVVGQQGIGEVEIRAGGLFADACVIGAEPGAFGTVRIFGAGAIRLNAAPNPGEDAGAKVSGKIDKASALPSISFPGFLEIGRNSNGLVELFDAGTRLTCSEAIIGGGNDAAGGTLNIDTGANFECDGSVTLGAGPGPALVRVADGAAMDAGISLIIGPKGLLIAGGFSKITAGSVLVNGRLRVLDGLAIERPLPKAKEAPKAGGGPAVIDGNLEMGPGAVLEVVAGTSGVLGVTGSATLDGTLLVSLQSGITLADDELLELIDFQGGVTGSFDTIAFENAPEGFEGDIQFEDGSLRLRVISGGTAPAEGEGEGEGIIPPPAGCQGCGGGEKSLAWADKLGSVLLTLFGFTILYASSLRQRTREIPSH